MKIVLHYNIGKILAFLIFICVTQLSAQVTLPHYDGLNYTIGQSLQTQAGWASLNSGDNILISSGDLTYVDLPMSSQNKISFDASGLDATKNFTPQSLGTGTTVYYSFLLNVSALGTLNVTGGYFTGLNDTSAGGFASSVWLRQDGFGFNIGLAARTTGSSVTWSSGTRSLGTTYLIVVSHQSVSGNANDVSKIWINPVLGANAQNALHTITNTGVDLSFGLNKIFIRQDSATATPFVEMDELSVINALII